MPEQLDPAEAERLRKLVASEHAKPLTSAHQEKTVENIHGGGERGKTLAARHQLGNELRNISAEQERLRNQAAKRSGGKKGKGRGE